MKARIILIAVALTALTLLSAGCKKNSFWSPTPGTPITYRFKSNMENPVETKTVYNDNEGHYFYIAGNPYEGIDWEVGDRLSVAYISAEREPVAEYAEYHISEVTATSAISGNRVVSTGKAVPSGDGQYQALYWHGGSYHEFYTTTLPPDFDYYATDKYKFEMKYDERLGETKAQRFYPDAYLPYYYPYEIDASHSDPDNPAYMDKIAAGVYCETMEYAYIYSINNGRMVPQYGDIELTLTPHFTAFEITVEANDGDVIPVNSFTLSRSNGYLAGEIPYITRVTTRKNDDDETEYYWTWSNLIDSAKDISSSVTINFSGENIILNGTNTTVNGVTAHNKLKFTFFTMDSGADHLTLTFNIQKDGVAVNRSLKLSYALPSYADESQRQWIWFSSSYKHRIHGLKVPLESNAMWFEGTDAGSYDQQDWNL